MIDHPINHPSAYPIETGRLLLRPFPRTDLDDLYAYHSRPEVTRYLYWEVRDRYCRVIDIRWCGNPT